MTTETGWYSSLAYAVLDRPLAPPSARTTPDVAAFLDDLDRHFPQELAALRQDVRTNGRLSAHPVPAAVRGPLGYAQLAALLRELEQRLLGTPAAAPIVQDRPLDAAERRLLADAPPHHRG